MKFNFNRLWQENKAWVLFIVLMVGFRSSLADWNAVPTGSMKPTILEGDRLWVDKLAYDIKLPLIGVSVKRLSDPQRGDIVVFDSKAAGKRLIKRVIGVPGDVVEMQANVLTINGEKAAYTFLRTQSDHLFFREDVAGISHIVEISRRTSPFSSFSPIKVPRDMYLVLGDNRDNSADFRVHGLVPRKEMVGRSQYVVMSLNYDHYYIPRSHRFFEKLDGDSR